MDSGCYIGAVICGLIMVVAEFPHQCVGSRDLNPRGVESVDISRGVRIQSEYGTAVMLPLSGLEPGASMGHHLNRRRGRELVADAHMTLHDDLLTKGYYTSRVFIGTPPQEFALIVDTGSTVTYVPCSTCTHCGHHQDPRFKPDNSSSYEKIGCRSRDCITGMCDSTNKQCRYERMYAEMSSSKGVLGKDELGFGPDSRLTPQALLFGCETAETGDLYLQHADGIMGLGRGPLSIVDQLVGSGAMADSFSLCYGGMDEGGGAMILGSTPPLPGMVFTPSDPNRSNYYNLNLSEIYVQGIRVDLDSRIFNGKFGTVLDSGTTYAYLPDQAFDAFRDAVIQQLGSLQAIDGPDPNYPDICYAGAGSPMELDKHFPPVDFIFGASNKVTLAPENYLFKHTKVPGAYCLGFFKNQDATTLLGGIVVRNMLVTYDRANHQIGFLKTNCSDLWSILPESQATPPGISSPPAGSLNPSGTSGNTSSALEDSAAPLPAQSPDSLAEGDQEYGGIELVITLDTNYTTFLNQTPLFLSSIAVEAGVSSRQVKLEEVKEETGLLVVHCIILAHSFGLFKAASVKAIVARLEDNAVHLPEVFGTYHLRSWKAMSISIWGGSKNMQVGILIGVLLAVLVVLSAIAGFTYHYRLRHQEKELGKYNSVDQEVTEEETLMDDQQL